MEQDALSSFDQVMEMKSLRRVIGTYLNYPTSAEEDVRRWENSYSRLPSKHKELLSHLPKKYAEVRRCIAKNASLIYTMLRYFEPPFQISEDNEADHDLCGNHRLENGNLNCRNDANGLRCKNMDERSEDSMSYKRLAVENEGNKIKVDVQCPYEDASALGRRPEADGGEWFESLYLAHVKQADIEKVRCMFRNIVRDWAKEGSSEREKCYKPILEELQILFPTIDDKARPSCLVPGAGLGRLALEISRLGFICQGNEFSYYVLICSSFILNHTLEPDEFTIHPWIHSNCNKVTDNDQLQSIRFPDIHPGSVGITEGFSMCAGDFVEVYSHESQIGAWDVVVTCFFIDTAHNIVEYIEIISRVLKPGGAWINLGPLLYHFADEDQEMSIELSLEDVKKVAFAHGFELKKETTLETPYTSCPTSMLQHCYYSAFWTMIKR